MTPGEFMRRILDTAEEPEQPVFINFFSDVSDVGDDWDVYVNGQKFDLPEEWL